MQWKRNTKCSPGSTDIPLTVSVSKGTFTLSPLYQVIKTIKWILNVFQLHPSSNWTARNMEENESVTSNHKLKNPSYEVGYIYCLRLLAKFSMFGLIWYKPGRRDLSSLTCLLIQMTVRMQERLISGLPPRKEIHFFCHQEFLFWVPGLFRGRQLSDALPYVLPRRKEEISKNDKAKYYWFFATWG